MARFFMKQAPKNKANINKLSDVRRPTRESKNQENKVVGRATSDVRRPTTMLHLALIVAVFAIAGFYFYDRIEHALGATYTFIQSDWSGGKTTNTAVHPTNQTNWTNYEATTDNQIATSTSGFIQLKRTTN